MRGRGRRKFERRAGLSLIASVTERVKCAPRNVSAIFMPPTVPPTPRSNWVWIQSVPSAPLQ
eukprot:1128598-Heterocapsa_arctica.AAC.1